MVPSEIAALLNSISSVEDITQLCLLESAYKAMSPSNVTDEVYRAVLGLFERFPDDDAYEIFFSFMHILEECRQYEPMLVDSVRRVPARLNLYMVDRLLNGGFAFVGHQSLRALLAEAVASETISAENTEFINESLKRHVAETDA